MRKLSGLWFASAVLAAALTTMGASAPRASELQTLRVSIIPISDVTPLFAAMRQGYFEQEGIKIETAPSAGGATGIPGLVAGSFDIVYGNVVSMLLAAQQGLDIRVLAPGTNVARVEDDASAIVVRADSGIASGKDLDGKTVGVNTRNNVIWLYARAWIRNTGGDPDKVTFREVPHPQMEDALGQKQIDAGFMVVPFVTVATEKPQYKAIAHPYSAVQPGCDVGMYLTTGKLLSDHPDTAAKFARALRRGIAWYNAHLDDAQTREIVASFTRLHPDVLKKIPLAPAPERVDPKQTDATMKLMIANKLLRNPLDIGPLIAPEAL
jgi:NitT/TauT family transport system substrate-binding protein